MNKTKCKQDDATLVRNKQTKKQKTPWEIKKKEKEKKDTNGIVEPPLTPTSLQRPLFFVPADKKPIQWLLFKTSLQWPPLYNGQFLVPKVVVVERFNCI